MSEELLDMVPMTTITSGNELFFYVENNLGVI